MRGAVIASATFLLCATAAAAQTDLSFSGNQAFAGTAVRTPIGESEYRLTRNLRFRIEATSEIGTRAAVSGALLDPYGHRRRLASTFDYYPVKDSGFHVSVGMRARPKLGTTAAISALNSELKARFEGLSQVQQLRANDGTKRRLPVATVGWTEALSGKSVVRFDAGAMMIRTQRIDPTLLAAAYPGAGSSGGNRLGASARVTLISRF